MKYSFPEIPPRYLVAQGAIDVVSRLADGLNHLGGHLIVVVVVPSGGRRRRGWRRRPREAEAREGRG